MSEDSSKDPIYTGLDTMPDDAADDGGEPQVPTIEAEVISEETQLDITCPHTVNDVDVDGLKDSERDLSGGTLRILSEVAYEKKRKRRKYRVEGKLVDPWSGKTFLDRDGKPVTAKAKLKTGDERTGTALVSYEFDGERVPLGSGQLATVTRIKRRIWPILLWLLLALLLILWLLLWHDPNAKPGYYDGKTDEEIARDLDADVDWWSMEISIKPVITVKQGETTCEARIENVAANHCDQVVSISLADSGEEIYRSGAIGPGEYIQDIELSRAFEPGSYDLIATFQGYEQTLALFPEDGGLIGHPYFGASCNAEITLVVT